MRSLFCIAIVLLFCFTLTSSDEHTHKVSLFIGHTLFNYENHLYVAFVSVWLHLFCLVSDHQKLGSWKFKLFIIADMVSRHRFDMELTCFYIFNCNKFQCNLLYRSATDCVEMVTLQIYIISLKSVASIEAVFFFSPPRFFFFF